MSGGVSREGAKARIKIITRRFPWQAVTPSDQKFWPEKLIYGFSGFGPLGRFGGGWRFCFGVEIGTSSMILNLGFGYVRINRVVHSSEVQS